MHSFIHELGVPGTITMPDLRTLYWCYHLMHLWNWYSWIMNNVLHESMNKLTQKWYRSRIMLSTQACECVYQQLLQWFEPLWVVSQVGMQNKIPWQGQVGPQASMFPGLRRCLESVSYVFKNEFLPGKSSWLGPVIDATFMYFVVYLHTCVPNNNVFFW